MAKRIRKDIVLLQLLLDNNKKIVAGLCLLAMNLHCAKIINGYELQYLRKYIRYHKPDNRRTRDGQAYYWIPGARKPRIAWLKTQIEFLNLTSS